jgi:hypothetical protein
MSALAVLLRGPPANRSEWADLRSMPGHHAASESLNGNGRTVQTGPLQPETILPPVRYGYPATIGIDYGRCCLSNL